MVEDDHGTMVDGDQPPKRAGSRSLRRSRQMTTNATWVASSATWMSRTMPIAARWRRA